MEELIQKVIELCGNDKSESAIKLACKRAIDESFMAEDKKDIYCLFDITATDFEGYITQKVVERLNGNK